MSALSCARPDAFAKRRLGRRRVPRSSSGPTACCKRDEYEVRRNGKRKCRGTTYGLGGRNVFLEEREPRWELLDDGRAVVRRHKVDGGLH